jgi:uncharacterized membrane protein HdeD (DUF308 family)
MAIFGIVGGAIEVVRSVIERGRRWGWSLASGAGGIVVGCIIVARPLYATLVGVTLLYLLFAASALTMGLAVLVIGRSVGTALLGILMLALGLLVLLNPLNVVGLAVLVQWIGLCAVVGGVCAACSAFLISDGPAHS